MKLLVSNLPLPIDQEKTRLIADVSASASSITVDNISGFAINQILLFGSFGDTNSTIIKTHAATAPTGSTITLASALPFDYYSDTPITILDYDQVEYSRATTLTGSKTVLATQAINADRVESYYKDLNNSTGFAFARFKNSITNTFSVYTTGVPYTGNTYLSAEAIIRAACDDAGVEIGGQYSTESMLLKDINDAQDAITDLDWIFELVKNDSAIQSTLYESTYDLNSLTYQLKYPGIMQGIKSVKFGSQPLKYVDNDEMDDLNKEVHHTVFAAQANVGATSITLSDTNELSASGYIYAGGQLISYTANSKATGVLSGISASNITAIITSGSSAWQNVSPGLPTKYTITVDNKIVLNVPVDSDYAGQYLKIEYLKALDRFTDFASVTGTPFPEIMPIFIHAKIEKRKRNIVLPNGGDDVYGKLMKEFTQALQLNYTIYKLPIMEESTYYNFNN